jgi:hypothetical protein
VDGCFSTLQRNSNGLFENMHALRDEFFFSAPLYGSALLENLRFFHLAYKSPYMQRRG